MGWKLSALIGSIAVVGIAVAGIGYWTGEPTRPIVHIPRAAALLLSNVTVVDPRNGSRLQGMSVLMDGGMIVAVDRDGSRAYRQDILRIDGAGRFVVPGYNDMHSHVLEREDPSGALALMLAYGVTGFRQMSGSDELLAERRESRLPLGSLAPALLIMPGALLTPLNASRPDEVRATVRHQKTVGADFIKAGLVDGPGLFAALDEGSRVGITVSGHVPPGTSVVAAATAGMRAIEHLGPANGDLIACSSDGDAILASLRARTKFPKMPEIHSLILEKLATKLLLRRVVNPAATDSEAGAVWAIQRALATYDETRCRSAARALRAAGNWQVPTLIRLKSIYLADDPSFARDPSLKYIAADELGIWQNVTQTFVSTYSSADRGVMRRGYDASLRLVKLLDEEGVSMLAGSDSVGAGWLVPGYSLHEEFDELARAGLTPLRILQMTTSDAADFLGRQSTMGEVAAGHVADLVLLDADPTKSVANLHRISGVIRAGSYLSGQSIAGMKKRIEKGRSFHPSTP